jgi:hypothetical protein
MSSLVKLEESTNLVDKCVDEAGKRPRMGRIDWPWGRCDQNLSNAMRLLKINGLRISSRATAGIWNRT